jgi:hypothetical protein
MVDRAGSSRGTLGTAAVADDDAPRPEGVAGLGKALSARAEDVVLGMQRRAAAGRDGPEELDDVVEAYFSDMVLVSTRAFAEWLSGASSEVAREAGRDAWHILGQLAATHEASLSDVIKRQLQWRDSVDEVLVQEAASLGCSDEALSTAMAMLQRSLDVTLVRMGGSFESERQRTHGELVRREDELTFLATHDPLTKLPNRTLMLDRLDRMLARRWRRYSSISTISRRSTTPSAMVSAISCSARSHPV